MHFGLLRLAGIVAIVIGIASGSLMGWATPVFLNPFVNPDMVGGIIFVVVFLVIIPLLGYLEMVFFWERYRFQPDLKKLRRSPQIGMGVIAPVSIGLAIGLGVGWAVA